MKQIKLLFIFSFLLVFTSCVKDSNIVSDKSLVGKWVSVFEVVNTYKNAEVIQSEKFVHTNTGNITFVFEQGDSGSCRWWGNPSEGELGLQIANFKYQLSNNSLLVEYDEEELSPCFNIDTEGCGFYNVDFDGENLVLTTEMLHEFSGTKDQRIITFKRN